MNIDLLKKIVETPGAPGHEKPIRDLVIDLIKDSVDEYRVDRMGNLIVRIKGDGPKVMAAAHLDEISLITTNVDKDGFIRFTTLGGLMPKH